MAYVPAALVLAGMAAYTVLAGADFGAGLWTLLAFGPDRARIRDQARHAMGPVWEANHVWLIFVLVVSWTAYPVAFGSIASTLAVPLLIAAIGITGRGAAYALRSVSASSEAARAAESMLGVSSAITPFALGTAAGAIATGRVPVGNAAGSLVSSWLAPAPVLTGILAVGFSGYLAAVFLAADSVRYGEPGLAAVFRRRALLAGLGTLTLCWRSRFGLARLTAALAVAAVVAGWAAAQTPRLLPGMTAAQAAAGRSTLTALVIAVACGSAVLVPALTLLFGLFLRGQLDTPESPEPGQQDRAAEVHPAPVRETGKTSPARTRARAGRPLGAAAVAGFVTGAGLLVFTDATWTQLLGVAALLVCAMAAFALAAGRPGQDGQRPGARY